MTDNDLLPLSLLVIDDQTWPRQELNQERVAEFGQAYTDEGPYALDPVEVVMLLSGKFLLINGRHRVAAREHIRATDVAAVVINHGEADPMQFGYEYALADTARSALPLTRLEKQRAVRRLLKEHPERTDVSIAALVGVSTKTVQRARKVGVSREDLPLGLEQPSQRPARPADVANALVRQLDRLWNARSIPMSIGIADTTKLGDTLADAFIDHFGVDDAVKWTERVVTWSARAHAVAVSAKAADE